MNLIDKILWQMADEDGVPPEQFVQFAAGVYGDVLQHSPEGEFAVRLSVKDYRPVTLQDNPSVRASIVQLISQLRQYALGRRVITLADRDGQRPQIVPVRMAV